MKKPYDSKSDSWKSGTRLNLQSAFRLLYCLGGGVVKRKVAINNSFQCILELYSVSARLLSPIAVILTLPGRTTGWLSAF